MEADYQEATHIPGTPRPPPTPHHKSKQEIKKTKPTSGLSEDIVQEKDLAYDKITKTVCKLLLDNPNAKVFITGHSLGGALATLYATMLHCSGETEMTSKIAAVYTFGQPRVGDIGFANYARRKFDNRYYRVVYCNDMVPRVPFDSDQSGVDDDEEPHEDQVFAYKHFGKCAYFNSVYDGKVRY
jgi:predicted lipase